MREKLFDPTFKTLQSEPPNTKGTVVEFSTTAASTIDFRGAEKKAYPVTFETFSPSEQVIVARLPQCTVFQKSEYMYPSRWERRLSEFGNKPASLFLRYVLNGNQKWFTYEYGVVVSAIDANTLSVLCKDELTRALPVEYKKESGKASLFQVGDSVLIFCENESQNRIVIGWACMLPRAEYTWGYGFLPGIEGLQWTNTQIQAPNPWPPGSIFYGNFWGWEGAKTNDFGSRDMEATDFIFSIGSSEHKRLIKNCEVIHFPKSTMQAARELTTGVFDPTSWAFDLIPALVAELEGEIASPPYWELIETGSTVAKSMTRQAWDYQWNSGYYVYGSKSVTVQNAYQKYTFSSELDAYRQHRILLKNKSATKQHYDRYYATWRDVYFYPGYGGHQIASPIDYPVRYWDTTRGLSICGTYVT